MVFFIYRSFYEGPLSKLVRHFPDATVLDWFRRVWDDAGADDAYAWVEREFGTNVYGLHTIFESGLPAPESMPELRELLEKHLYVEQELRVDEHSVRVLTDDDEVDLAYFFVDDALVAAEPDRWAYLLHEGWELPFDGSPAGGVFVPPQPPAALTSAPPGGEGVTYAVVLTFYASGDSIGWCPPYSFPGVRLPRLAAALRASGDSLSEWPGELLVLRALVAPGEGELRPALERCNRWPIFGEEASETFGAHAQAHETALRRVEAFEPAHGRDPERTLIRQGEHVAQMSIHIDSFFGYQQWFFFDDVWASAHPDLATSLLHYGAHWDPRCSRGHGYYTDPC
ncbi:hypothetical protein Aph01nite_41040 [Acrocarpospora phusangensis]|uniref:Uncharacterized protein n=1 Tax=Acrocarpospora phusangensis TaxID=1070424 RepID=A0A919QDN6_9ACTN|nr:hypothetical protein [Acrocarpospora phusangensis]GIH25794.1 hypothetical protein Aph01nite_41040 [Acrocarpospora phusangensis]